MQDGVSAAWSSPGWPAYRYADLSPRVVAVSGADGADFSRVPGRAAQIRPGLQRDRRKRSHRDHRGGLDAPPAEPAGVVPDRARPGAVRHGRRARLQLPRAVRHPAAVPVDRGPGLSGGLPSHDRRAAAADPPTQPRTRLGQPDRCGGRDDRPRTAVVGLPDRALHARCVAVHADEAGFDRLPARRHPVPRSGCADGGRCGPAQSGLLPDDLRYRRRAVNRLDLWLDRAPRHLPPGRSARRRMDRLLHPLGRRGAAPLDENRLPSRRRPAQRSHRCESPRSPPRR
jgi:hypothetical protein